MSVSTPVFLRYIDIFTVGRFAGIKFFARYQYQYDKNTFSSIFLWYIAQLYFILQYAAMFNKQNRSGHIYEIGKLLVFLH